MFSKWSENEAKQTPAMEMEELKSQANLPLEKGKGEYVNESTRSYTSIP